MIEPTGSQSLVHFKYGGKTVTAIADGERRMSVGDTYQSFMERHRIHVFDAQSGARVSS